MLLIRTGPHRYRLAITNHHLLADGWSLPLILADLLQLYATAGARAFTLGARTGHSSNGLPARMFQVLQWC